MTTFKCTQCQLNRHLCKKYGDEGQFKLENAKGIHVENTLDMDPTKSCAMSGCGKWYPEQCLTITPLRPQAIVTIVIFCPDHSCHTCASDNHRDPIMKYNEKLMHCICCPTAYHCGDFVWLQEPFKFQRQTLYARNTTNHP